MRALGVDLGERRVGIALSDRTGTLASPFVVLERGPDLHGAIARIVEEEEVATVVVGLPRSMDGRDRAAAGKARKEAGELARHVGAVVELHDERLSTVSAHAGLAAAGRTSRKRRGMVDAAAAAVILQSWLDSPAGQARREALNEVNDT